MSEIGKCPIRTKQKAENWSNVQNTGNETNAAETRHGGRSRGVKEERNSLLQEQIWQNISINQGNCVQNVALKVTKWRHWMGEVARGQRWPLNCFAPCSEKREGRGGFDVRRSVSPKQERPALTIATLQGGSSLHSTFKLCVGTKSHLTRFYGHI